VLFDPARVYRCDPNAPPFRAPREAREGAAGMSDTLSDRTTLGVKITQA
jgi:hypothetical protein